MYTYLFWLQVLVSTNRICRYWQVFSVYFCRHLLTMGFLGTIFLQIWCTSRCQLSGFNVNVVNYYFATPGLVKLPAVFCASTMLGNRLAWMILFVWLYLEHLYATLFQTCMLVDNSDHTCRNDDLHPRSEGREKAGSLGSLAFTQLSVNPDRIWYAVWACWFVEAHTA